MKEQRRDPRAPVDVSVTFVVKGEAAVRAGRARDVSLGGMFVETEHAAAFGAEVVVSLLAGGELLELPARVRWGRPGGMGVQFGLLGARETRALGKLGG